MKTIRITPSVLIAGQKQEIHELSVENQSLRNANKVLNSRIDAVEDQVSRLRYTIFKVLNEIKDFQIRFTNRANTKPNDKFAYYIAPVIEDLVLRVTNHIDEHKVNNDS